MSETRLEDFIRESNRIEGILRESTDEEIRAHEWVLSLSSFKTETLEGFVEQVAGARLRDKQGMDVRVGSHFPDPGGPGIRRRLNALVREINEGAIGPYLAHVRYERLHPFMDGNGRSGRVIWAWMMQRDGADPFSLPFLHRFYYQALDASR